jgi:membrane protein implicated in regulation of membrane protease activity
LRHMLLKNFKKINARECVLAVCDSVRAKRLRVFHVFHFILFCTFIYTLVCVPDVFIPEFRVVAAIVAFGHHHLFLSFFFFLFFSHLLLLLQQLYRPVTTTNNKPNK